MASPMQCRDTRKSRNVSQNQTFSFFHDALRRPSPLVAGVVHAADHESVNKIALRSSIYACFKVKYNCYHDSFFLDQVESMWHLQVA
jgi:hypothetical protein